MAEQHMELYGDMGVRFEEQVGCSVFRDVLDQ